MSAPPVPDRRNGRPESPPIARGLGRLALAGVTLLWVRIVHDAWVLRSIVADYEAIHGKARLAEDSGADHLQVLDDELLAVGADYFYPFGALLILGVGALWLGAAALATIGSQRLGRWLLTGGVVAVVVQMVLFTTALGTYVLITD